MPKDLKDWKSLVKWSVKEGIDQILVLADEWRKDFWRRMNWRIEGEKNAINFFFKKGEKKWNSFERKLSQPMAYSTIGSSIISVTAKSSKYAVEPATVHFDLKDCPFWIFISMLLHYHYRNNSKHMPS